MIVAVNQTFDARGNLASSVRTEDFGIDGVIDFASNKTLDYDTRGNLVLAVTTSGNPESPPRSRR